MSAVLVVAIPSTKAASTPFPEDPNLDRNLILAVALSMLVFTSWSAWQASMAPTPEELAVLEEGIEAPDSDDPDSENTVANSADSPLARSGTSTQEAAEIAVYTDEKYQPEIMSERAVAPWSRDFESERVSSRLTNRGATFEQWLLKDYAASAGAAAYVELLGTAAPYDIALATPFEELGVGDLSDAIYEVESASDDEVVFVLTRGGVRVRRRTAGPRTTTATCSISRSRTRPIGFCDPSSRSSGRWCRVGRANTTSSHCSRSRTMTCSENSWPGSVGRVVSSAVCSVAAMTKGRRPSPR